MSINTKKLLRNLSIPFVIFFILEFLTWSASGIYKSIWVEKKHNSSNEFKDSLRIVCIGESTTQLGGQDSYPRSLQRILNKRYPDNSIIVFNEGISATSTSIIKNKISSIHKRLDGHIYILMMGVNDFWMLSAGNNEESGIRSFFYNYSKLFKIGYYIYINYFYQSDEKPLLSMQQLNSNKDFRTTTITPEKDSKGLTDTAFRLYSLGELNAAIEVFEKAKKERVLSEDDYRIMGEIYMELGDVDKSLINFNVYAQTSLEKSMLAYKLFHRYDHSANDVHLKVIEEISLSAVKLDVKQSIAYDVLALVFERRNDDPAKNMYIKLAIDNGSINSYSYLMRSGFLLNTGRSDEAQQLLEKNLELAFLDNNQYYIAELYQMFKSKEEHKKAESLLNKGITKLANNMFLFNIKNKQNVLSRESMSPTQIAQHILLKRTTKNNYFKISHYLIDQGAKVVVTQYPTLPIKPLKDLLNSIKDQVEFIENKDVFEIAIDRDGFEHLFSDRFGGSFGHFTKDGAKVFSENLANNLDYLIRNNLNKNSTKN